MLDDLRNEIDRYLIGRVNLRHLESWLVTRLQSILDSGDVVLIDVANALDADLVEYGEGLLGETELNEHLEVYLRGLETMVLDERLTKIATETSAETVEHDADLRNGVTIRLPMVTV